MKKLLLSLVALTATLFSVAQTPITINITDVANIGTTLEQRFDTLPLSTIKAGPAGANKVWNFSGVHAHDTSTLYFVNPATTAFATVFPASNIAVNYDHQMQYYFFNKSSSSIVSNGGVMDLMGNGDTIKLVYSKPDTMLTFPSTYQSHFIANCYGKKKSTVHIVYGYAHVDSVEITHHQADTSIVDAWGTLTTPDGTVPVIRQKLKQVISDSIRVHIVESNSWMFFQERKDTAHYMVFWAKNIGYPIVKMEYDITDSIAKNIEWIHVAGLGIYNPTIENNLKIFPNPVNDNLNVALNADSKNLIIVSDIYGRNIVNKEVSNESLAKINTSQLSNGVYFITVYTNNAKAYSSKFIVKH